MKESLDFKKIEYINLGYYGPNGLQIAWDCKIDGNLWHNFNCEHKNTLFRSQQKSNFDGSSYLGIERFTGLTRISIQPIKGEIYRFYDNKNLLMLDVRGNQREKNKLLKISNLDTLKYLRELYLKRNEIQNISNLEELKNLNILDISNNKIKKITGLEELKNLRKLHLDYNKIKKIENLDSLKLLEELYLRGNNLKKMENINHLENVEILDLSKTYIEKVEDIETLKKLKLLDLSFTNVYSADFISDLVYFKFEKGIKIHTYDEIIILDIDQSGYLKFGNVDSWCINRLANCMFNRYKDLKDNFLHIDINMTPFNEYYSSSDRVNQIKSIFDKDKTVEYIYDILETKGFTYKQFIYDLKKLYNKK